ncbi:coadhesin [Patella vulgata]|uniref:coadhesin n=1 Tax=Patella vulgata TaxID=6465 RepID=UPI002180806C|nr:coadhesin [Patella vulgata]
MRLMLVATLLLVIITVVDAGRRHRARNRIRHRSYGRQASVSSSRKQINCNKIRRRQACSKCCSVDGNWGQWSEFNPCSVTCGEGTQSRSRSCDNPPPAYDGADCNGDGTETRSCNTIECLVDGNWGAWSEFSACCPVCGVVEQTRSRVCDNPAPGPGGADCPGDSEETRTCDSNDCLDNAPISLCEGQSFDVIVLLDVSAGSITDEGIAQARNLIQGLYTELRIDGNLRRFGFIAYAGAMADFNRLVLGADDTATQQSRIDGISVINGPPNLETAISVLVSDFTNLGRTGIRQIGIVIGASDPFTIDDVTRFTNPAKEANIALYAVGIVDLVNEEYLQAIATNASGAITATSEQLEETATRLEQLICLCDK